MEGFVYFEEVSFEGEDVGVEKVGFGG